MWTVTKFLRRPVQRLRTAAYPIQHRVRLRWQREHEPTATMLFDASTRYGGLVDRFKGIISVYDLARSSRRAFKLYAGTTFPILEFLEPATFDWRTTPDRESWHPLTTRFHLSRDRKVPAAFKALASSVRRELFVDTNLDYLPELHPELAPAELHALWGRRFRELFRPTVQFESELQAHSPGDAVAIHARFTNLLGDFKDVVTNALPVEKANELLEACCARVRVLAASEAPRTMIVFADSPTFLSRMQTIAPNVTTLPGTPAHIDHTDHPVETMRKTLLDFFTMARCSKIVMLRIGSMYDSAFSRYASYVHDVPLSEAT